MTKEPRGLTKEAVLAIQERLLAEHGGPPGILDEGLLDAALAAPKNHFAYEQADPFHLAAVYAHGLTRNHPFADGNKRVALTVAGVFLGLNGFRLEAPEQEAFAAIMGLSERTVGVSELADWLKASCTKLPAAKKGLRAKPGPRRRRRRLRK